MTLKERVSMIFNEWWHTNNEETLQGVARDLVAHGYSEDDAARIIETVCGVVKSEYGE